MNKSSDRQRTQCAKFVFVVKEKIIFVCLLFSQCNPIIQYAVLLFSELNNATLVQCHRSILWQLSYCKWICFVKVHCCLVMFKIVILFCLRSSEEWFKIIWTLSSTCNCLSLKKRMKRDVIWYFTCLRRNFEKYYYNKDITFTSAFC